MYAEHGQAFIECNLSYRLYDMLSALPGLLGRDELTGETIGLFESYAAKQTEIGNYRSSSLAQAMLRLLPAMSKQGRHEAALRLLSPLLERYTAGGSADFERMRLARWQDHLRQTIAPEPRLSRDQVTGITLPASDHDTRIKKLIHAAGRVWILRCDYSLQDGIGELYFLPDDGTQATRETGVEGVVTDIAASSDLVAVATIDRGLFLLNGVSDNARHLDPNNSPLPSERIRTLATDGRYFYIGLFGKQFYHIYQLDPQENTLRDRESKIGYHAYYQTRYSQTEKRLVVQTWDERSFDDDGQTRWLRRRPHQDAVHVSTVSDDTGQKLFEYTGIELNYVYDFIRWHDRLIFATGNGLYVVSPTDRKLRCVMNDLDLEFFSLCGVDDILYVGTNQGLFGVSSRLLDAFAGDPAL
jgi:hypothetical protein